MTNPSAVFTVIRMLENSQNVVTILPDVPYHQLNNKDCFFVIGSCNGLLCLFGHEEYNGYRDWWFRFWNPATRTISEKLGSSRECDHFHLNWAVHFTLGYDKSRDTFKVVHLFPKTTKVRVFSLRNNAWRDIQNSPVAYNCTHHNPIEVVHLSGSVNWLAIRNLEIKKIMIVRILL
jgi:F-box interacting protein